MCLEIFKGIFHRGGSTGEVPSPRNDIAWDDVVTNGRVIINGIDLPIIKTTVQNTNSMEPLLDVGHTVIGSSAPKYMDDIKVGDIIVWGDGNIIHSVIEIGLDSEGWFCYTQGINITRPDGVKVRKTMIHWVALMIIWSKSGGILSSSEGD